MSNIVDFFEKRESRDPWLRNGVRLTILLMIGFVFLLTVALLEDKFTGDVSGITRLAYFAFLVCSVPTSVVAVICVVTGLFRRYLLRKSN